MTRCLVDVSPLCPGLSCVPVLPPRRGSFYVETGTGVSIGTVLAFWCREGYQLVGSDKIYCNVRNGKPLWSNYLPVCEGKKNKQGCNTLIVTGSGHFLHLNTFSSPSSDPQAGGPRSESGRAGFSGEWHRHPRHVPVVPHLLPARTIRQGQSQERGTEQVGPEGRDP